MTFAKRYGLTGLKNQLRRLMGTTDIRGAFIRTRHIENNIDWPALNITIIDCTDPATGKFWFVPGYSIVGGGDIVRP